MPDPGKNSLPAFSGGNLPLAKDMPLATCLYRLAKANRDSWHMPGHDGGRAWPAWLRNSLAALDTTELPMTGDLNHPSGPVREAEELAAAAFGSGCSRLITSGSTNALRIMLALFAGRHGKVMMPRASHQSLINAAAMLDLEICWLLPRQSGAPADPFDLIPRISAEDIEAGFVQFPDCRVVLITNPDYYGGCQELDEISRIVHGHGACLLVDEAHGAHLAFGGNLLPASAMKSGADASVNSGHKTLPVLTAGAWLHIAASALDTSGIIEADLDRLIPVFQTSSPSFPIAATLDYARAWMMASGQKAIQQQLSYAEIFRSELPDEFQVPSGPCSAGVKAAGFARDPLRLVIRREKSCGKSQRAGLAVAPAAAWLSGEGIDVEFADMTRMVLIPPLTQTKTNWIHLTDTLRTFTKTNAYSGFWADDGQDGAAGRLDALENEWRRMLSAVPDKAMPPGEALFSRHRLNKIHLRDAAGRISAASVMPYPPGIPVICPGEIIDQARVDFLTQLIENGINICGIDQGCLLAMS
jgi:lysine decarboxylase